MDHLRHSDSPAAIADTGDTGDTGQHMHAPAAQVIGMVACPYCDLLQQEVDLGRRCDAHCLRCDGVLYRGGRIQLDTLIALASAGALLFLISNLFPIAALGAQGIDRSTTLVGSALALYQQGRFLVAALVLITTVLIPGLQLGCLLYALVPLRLGRVPRGIASVYRMLVGLNPWSMMEVFLLGALVTLIKLADLATVVPGVALWTFGGLIVLQSLVSCFFSARDFWSWVESVQQEQLRLQHA
jgi:paraquat-inducible protein A